MVFLNLEGREPQGIVTKDEARGVMEAIQSRFLAAEDEGRKAGSSATIIQDVYTGPEEWGTLQYRCADVMLGFAEYYRVSWSTVGGTLPLKKDGDKIVPKPIYSDNTNPWSGDHASNDPNLVTGIFFCSRKVSSADGKFSVMDIAPTVLSRLGAPSRDRTVGAMSMTEKVPSPLATLRLQKKMPVTRFGSFDAWSPDHGFVLSE